MTPQKIESLREDSKRAHVQSMAFFAKMKPKGKGSSQN